MAVAAVEAVKTPGTELGGTEVAGSRRGVRGLWVELRHRRRRPQTEAEAPESADESDGSGESDDVRAEAATAASEK